MVETPTHIFILEFKLDKSAEVALLQIKEREYAAKYVGGSRPKVLVGINLSRAEKTVDNWLVETVGQ